VREFLTAALVLVVALQPVAVRAASAWGSAGYGDPPGWCTNLSDMWTSKVVTNDPLVRANPERDTFYGFHPNPGYDDWYGYFYGDFRGVPGDASGWVKLLHETYPQRYHWNFADNGWAVHGHVKQYIAYYNWTFGGQCGLGAYGGDAAPPFMADQYGYPVVDIYVDSVAPFTPRPYVAAVTSVSVSLTWDPVADRGDGAGADFFMSGVDHYVSWLTTGGSARLQLASTTGPRVVSLVGLRGGDVACLHVVAVDAVGNASPQGMECGSALVPPPAPSWPDPGVAVAANPSAPGLVGVDTWLWLAPLPLPIVVQEVDRGVGYTVSATPVGARWDFGDGDSTTFEGAAGFGTVYPAQSSVTHVYQAHRAGGYAVQAFIRYAVSWTAHVAGRDYGPYPMDALDLAAIPLAYAVRQAEPELVET
jgi:hypothetical protein